MAIPEPFKAYVAAVVSRHFGEIALPGDCTTTERNRIYLAVRERAYAQMHRNIRKRKVPVEIRKEMRDYAAAEAQGGMYNLYTGPVKQNPRYKGMQGR